jgi:hypothetical protein
LQKRLRQLSGAGPAVTADKEAAAKRAAEEATVKRVVEEVAAKAAATEEAMVKRAAEERVAEEAMVKAAATEATRATGGSPARSQVLPTTGAKRPAAPSGSTPPSKRPYRGVWKPRFVQLSPRFYPFLFFSLL